MLLKVVYSIVIVCCSSLLGFIFANTYIERTKLLNSLLSTIQMLETEIVYGATPIPILLEKVGNKSRKEIGSIFFTAADLLSKKQGQTFEEIWHISVSKETEGTCFNKDDIEILLSLGKNLGISNCEDQTKHIRLVQEDLKRHYELSILEQGRNVKLFKNLGFLLGLSIIIILY
ncbi:stage III sporulation protein SpoIIIAB [Alkaliphilus sp. B6464]|uniref:stage III sporulation protein SpoIIIAB n=1 Tax=Alkaliphilus sp. B6464 TaxID=2731219 RepID=UPI001BAC2799|nr:stage III sporulation protein SpoIIIAB [Alkaliphilus sp. B6464]QUH20689.1 stage III sporulation protein AB [Alkaliphilus sp. B6464]